jgi:Ca2+-binding EF-hand superfamily protein
MYPEKINTIREVLHFAIVCEIPRIAFLILHITIYASYLLQCSLADRGTDGSGFSDLQRRFQAIDREGSKCVTIEEFKIAFQRCNLSFTDGELSTLFYFFDCNQKNYIDYDDFIFGIRGPVSGERKELIERAFQQVDGDGEGLVAPEEIIDRYDPTQHPDVKNGIKKAQEVFRDFLRSFQVTILPSFMTP